MDTTIKKIYSRPKDDSFESYKEWFRGLCSVFVANPDDPNDRVTEEELKGHVAELVEETPRVYRCASKPGIVYLS